MGKLRRYDTVTVKDYWISDEGYLTLRVGVTRPGVFPYLRSDGTIQYELKHPEDVFSNLTMESAKGKPVTEDHPHDKVDMKNFKRHAKGLSHTDVQVKDGMPTVTVTVFDEGLAEKIQSGDKREISIGFDCDLVPERGTYDGQQYDFKQTNIVINHLAFVEKGRAGPTVGARNDDAAWQIDKKDGGAKMPTVRIDGKDYEVPQEVKSKFDEAQAKANQLDAVTGERDSLKSQLETAKGQLDSKDVEIKTLKDELEKAKDQKPSQDELDAAVKERLALVDTARDYVKDFDPEGKSNKDIKVLVIQTLDEEFKPDEKSDEYIDARYDGAVSVLKNMAHKTVGDRSLKIPGKGGAGLDEKRQKRLNMRNKEAK